MTVRKKRPSLPDEDLAAAVADIISSPITRTNLRFLRPPEPEETATPVGLDPIPVDLIAPLLDSEPLGVRRKPPGVELDAPGLAGKPAGDLLPPSGNPSAPPRVLWQAEGIGTLFEQSRVRRIERAQDALSLVEEKVYDILWGVRNQRRDEYRLVHYSLQRLAGEARINIKTVRELIPRLIDKEFIRIELAADPRKNTATLYRVWSYSSVLALQRQKNRQYVVKTGKGVFYARAVKASLDAAPFPLDDESGPMGVTPAGAKSAPTGAEAAPAGASPTGPMGGASTKPMGSGGTVSIDISEATTRQTSSSTYAAMIGAIQSAFGTEPDSGLLDYMIADCNRNAVEATGEPARDEELIYFTQSKARVLARAPNIRNHMAVLRRALPECFCGEAFRIYRQAAEAREKSAAVVVAGPVPDPLESEKLARWTEINERHRTARGYDLKAIAEDADLDEHGRTVARERLLRQGRYTEQGI